MGRALSGEVGVDWAECNLTLLELASDLVVSAVVELGHREKRLDDLNKRINSLKAADAEDDTVGGWSVYAASIQEAERELESAKEWVRDGNVLVSFWQETNRAVQRAVVTGEAVPEGVSAPHIQKFIARLEQVVEIRREALARWLADRAALQAREETLREHGYGSGAQGDNYNENERLEVKRRLQEAQKVFCVARKVLLGQ